VRLEELSKIIIIIKKFIDFIGNGTRDVPVCSVVTQPTTLTRAPLLLEDSATEEMKLRLLLVKSVSAA
jgi:hypothetical protein